MSVEPFSRSRAPMGGAERFEPALCEAGQMYPFESRVVKRKACLIGAAPETSSYLTRPGRMARPAASALVHPSGRRWSESSEKMAPEPAIHEHDREPDGV